MINPDRFTKYNKTFLEAKNSNYKDNNSFLPQKIGENISLNAGVDADFYAISIIGKDTEIQINSTTLIEARKVDTAENHKKAYIFRLLNEELLSIFISFAIDLESVIDTNQNVTINEIYNRYLYWQEMFKVAKYTLSEEKIKGLLNELIILNRYMIPKYGVAPGVRGWIGSEGMKKDFAYSDGNWYEAKAVTAGRQTVIISSLEQLQANTEGYLVISNFEGTSSQNPNGIRIIDEIKELLSKIEVEDIKLEIYSKINQLGLSPDVFYDENNPANGFRYIIHSISFYKVDKDFPKLTQDMLPKEITAASYSLQISEIEKYKI